MELLEGIETRRSVRAFKPTPIPVETLRKILKTASKSPSAINSQPWEVAVVTGRKRDELSKILCEMKKTDVPPNPDFPAAPPWPDHINRRITESTDKLLQAIGIGQYDKQSMKKLKLLSFEFYGAPCVLFLLMDRSFGHWAIFDMGLFSQSIALAAHSYGLGTCMQGTLCNYPDTVRNFLGIPETKHILLGISIGYPDLDSKMNSYQSSRVSIDEFVQWYS